MKWLTVVSLLLATALNANEIPSPAPPNAAEPFLSSSSNGLLMSWLEEIAGTDHVALRFARYSEGRWSEPRTIAERNDFFVNWADFPSIIEDEHGVLFAHWLQKSGGGHYAYDVKMSICADGGKTWSTPVLLNGDGRQGEHGFVSLAALPGGGAGATWLDGRNMVEGKEEGDMTIRYAVVDKSGAISAEVELDSRTCECCTTAIAMTTSGPVIAYRDRTADEVRDIVAVRKTTAGWTKPRLVHSDGWKIAGCPVNGPQLDAEGTRVVAAWFSASHDIPRVRVAFSNNAGASFGQPVVVDGGRPAGRVDVVMIGNAAVVTWVEQTATGAEIRARRVDPDGKAAPSVKIADSSTARAAGFPRIARLGSHVYFAWTDQAAKTKRIRVAEVGF